MQTQTWSTPTKIILVLGLRAVFPTNYMAYNPAVFQNLYENIKDARRKFFSRMEADHGKDFSTRDETCSFLKHHYRLWPYWSGCDKNPVPGMKAFGSSTIEAARHAHNKRYAVRHNLYDLDPYGLCHRHLAVFLLQAVLEVMTDEEYADYLKYSISTHSYPHAQNRLELLADRKAYLSWVEGQLEVFRDQLAIAPPHHPV